MLEPTFAGHLLAYIDPGTGSLILQAVLGTILGVLFFAKGLWKRLFGRIAAFFRRKPAEEELAPAPREGSGDPA